jgi:hypothetical protein
MANPADILNDPNFTNANAATKQAIFAKHVATDPDFLKANADTQRAIKLRFGFAGNEGMSSEGMPAAKQGTLAQIGTGLASLADTTVGGVLPLLGQGVQAVARPFTSAQQAEQMGGAVTSAIDKPFGKAFGVTEQPAYKQESSRQLIDFIGQNVSKGADWISSKTGLPVEDVRNMLGTSMLAAPGAVKSAVPVVKNALAAAAPVAENALATVRATPLVQAVEAPLAARAAKIQEANVTKSYQNAPKIDAAQLANKHGIALNPAISNPNKSNKIRAAVAGDANTNAVLSQANEPKWTQLTVEKGLELPPNTLLDASAIDTALTNASKPYDVVRAMPQILPDKATITALESLKKPPSAVAKGKVEASNMLIDDMIAEIQQGRSGADVLNDIRQLRAEANSVYKARDKGLAPIKASEVAEADARMGVANAYEKMIDANVTDPKILADLQAARTKMAQIYDIQRATDFATNSIDPKAFAKMFDERKGNMTGIGADIGRIAANYPEIAKIGAKGSTEATLTRGGVAGTIGFGVGSLMGAPYAGSVLGGATGYLAGKVNAKNMVSPAYQAARAMPPDYRLNTLAPLDTGNSQFNFLSGQ